MKKIIFISIIILSIIVKNNYAQNLVPNSSFEIYSSCPTGPSQTNKAVPWYDPTAGSSDYDNSCDIGFANVPFCAGGNGYQFARTGNAYAGLYALNGMGNANREYIQVQLVSPLIADSCYLVEFYCNLMNNMGYSINKLGAYISSIAVNAVGPGSVMSYTPQITSHIFLSDTINWMHVSGYYHAIGGEKFITIGDYKPFSASDTLNTGLAAGYYGAYYLIDDVSIVKVAGCDTTLGVHEINYRNSFTLSPNPNNGEMVFEYSLPLQSSGIFILYDITGRTINKYKLTEGQNNLLKISETELKNGIYFYSVLIDGKMRGYDKIVVVK
jgi:hypothetical protein